MFKKYSQMKREVLEKLDQRANDKPAKRKGGSDTADDDQRGFDPVLTGLKGNGVVGEA